MQFRSARALFERSSTSEQMDTPGFPARSIYTPTSRLPWVMASLTPSTHASQDAAISAELSTALGEPKDRPRMILTVGYFS